MQGHAGNFANRFVVCEPATHIDIHRRIWTSPLDPMTHGGKDLHNSRATIIACRPYEWRNEFPVVAEASPEMREQTLRKWGHVLTQAKTLGTT